MCPKHLMHPGTQLALNKTVNKQTINILYFLNKSFKLIISFNTNIYVGKVNDISFLLCNWEWCQKQGKYLQELKKKKAVCKESSTSKSGAVYICIKRV